MVKSSCNGTGRWFDSAKAIIMATPIPLSAPSVVKGALIQSPEALGSSRFSFAGLISPRTVGIIPRAASAPCASPSAVTDTISTWHCRMTVRSFSWATVAGTWTTKLPAASRRDSNPKVSDHRFRKSIAAPSALDGLGTWSNSKKRFHTRVGSGIGNVGII